MEIFYVRTPNIHVAIDNGKIFHIQRNDKRSINSHATISQTLSATPFGDWGVRDETLYLDGLMLVEMAAFIYREIPTNTHAFGKRFFNLFKDGDGALLPDTVNAICRVVLNQTSVAVGEDALFANQQWHQHPIEFAALMLAQLLIPPRRMVISGH